MTNKPLHQQTPILDYPALSARLNKNILLKMECYQPTGSFKIRGIGHICQNAVNRGITHLISSSGGNAGYATAYAGKQLGVKVTVVVPQSTTPEVRKKIELFDAEVIVKGRVWDETNEYAISLAEPEDCAYISPFDHPDIWEGHASLIDEAVTQCEKPDLIVLSVGGGGLLCGVLEGLHRNNWQDVPVAAVETWGTASLKTSIEKGELTTLTEINSIASSLAAKRVSQKAWEWTKKHPIFSMATSDQESVAACIELADNRQVVVEPACGASLAVLSGKEKVIQEANTILCIVCGGVGVTLKQLMDWENIFR